MKSRLVFLVLCDGPDSETTGFASPCIVGDNTGKADLKENNG